ncbi:MAG: YeeE/YedE family protein [Myxococcota bacterium]|jgi:hypothetical protein|nr:YeeE/YedE family protein [Myxococcota bacterium]
MIFDPAAALNAVLGGALIGLSVSFLLLVNGRVAGISGILGSLLRPEDGGWAPAFVGGLLAGGLVLLIGAPQVIAPPSGHSVPLLVVAGLLVGIGTRMGGGCTSGHGICGLTRLSGRSLVATCTFMAIGMAAACAFHVLGGGS